MTKVIDGYALEESKYIKEIDSEVLIYSHNKTKAQLLLIANEDKHKSFCIGFRTPPKDSTGVPHIIEHSVLCGSKKYPLKDPFVELAKGSLNTYLNAMTYPDKTLYPISSQNDKDFHNLMEVYLDAVFFPNIYKQKEILMQEGWRYHIEDESDPLTYKGVVYNEMKGAFSSPEEVAFRKIKESLFPDTIYANESGGAPEHITELTYEDFLAFHKKYYHPSNSYIILYGDIEVEQTLDFLDKQYLSHFEYQLVDSKIPLQKPFTQPLYQKEYYPVTTEKPNSLLLSYNKVIGEIKDRRLILGMNILEYILLETPASPLKKALISSGIGEDVFGVFQTHLQQPIFSVVAKNVLPEKQQAFYDKIQEVLTTCVKEGIPKHLIKSAIAVKEFELREGDASGYSKGLLYGIAAIKSWIYDASPFTYLEYEEDLAFIKENQDKGYFEQLIKEYILDNTHCSMMELYPKLGLEKEIQENLKQKLERIKQGWTQEELQKRIEETKQFETFQLTPDDEKVVETIPLLQKQDLDTKAPFPRYDIKDKDGIHYITTPVFTNQIVYMNWYMKINNIPQESLPYLGMIVGMLGKLDTKYSSYEDLSVRMDETVGGMSYGIQSLHLMKEEEYLPLFLCRSKALVNKVQEQSKLMKEVLQDTKFDNEARVLELIREMKAIMESALGSDGHKIAYSRLLSHFTAGEYFEEITKGLSFYEKVCAIEKDWNTSKKETIEALKTAYSYLANQENLVVGITCDEKEIDGIIEKVAEVVETMPKQPISPTKIAFTPTPIQEALVYPGNVNYVATGSNFHTEGYKYHGSMLMLKSILSMNYLWNEVRVKNGAYGCFCDFRRSGNMFFVSYRDPNITNTLDTYKAIPAFLQTLTLSERELLQYLIGTISNLDFPFTPPSEGKAAQVYYLAGISKKQLQQTRDELFATDSEMLRSFAPLVEKCISKDQYCVFTNPHDREKTETVFTVTTNL